MRVINTLFSHNVYSGIHAVFSEACKQAGIRYIICDDPVHSGIKIGKSNVITKFNYMLDGKKLVVEKKDIVITRSVFNTIQPLQFLATRRNFFISEESWGEKPFKKKFYSSVGKSIFKKVPFITQTLKSKKFLESFGLRCFHIPPFTKASFSMDSGKHILYVARMEEIKNPDLIIDLAKAMPDQKFVIVATLGNIEIMQRIKKEAANLKNVKFFEKIPYESLQQLYKDAKVLLLPTSADPIGYCVVEALSFASPVLTTKYAGTADYLDENWVVDTFDSSKWVAKIKLMLKSESENRKMAKELFLKHNLDIGGKYFNKLSKEIAVYLINQKSK